MKMPRRMLDPPGEAVRDLTQLGHHGVIISYLRLAMQVPQEVFFTENLTREELMERLLAGYAREYDEYQRWGKAVTTLAEDDEEEACEAARRMMNNYSHRLDGYKAAAANALDICTAEFLNAVSKYGKGEGTP